MTHILVKQELTRTNGLAEDVVVNTFVFAGADTPAVMAAECFVRVRAFYESVTGPNGTGIIDWISPVIGRNPTIGAVFKAYDLTGKLAIDPALADDDHPDGKFPPMGSPVHEEVMGLRVSALSQAPLPSEVALCGTYHAALGGTVEEQVIGGVTTRPRARKRGRLYIGPLVQPAVGAIVNGEVRPAVNLQEDIEYACEQLVAGGPSDWVVWSRAAGLTYIITGGWVDDAFDTQRRRGGAATNRTAWGTV